MELRDRLRLALGEPSADRPGRPGRAHQEADAPRQLGVRREETPAGPVYVSQDQWPLTHRHGDYQLGEALDAGTAALSRLAPSADSLSLRRAAFVDVETTGLSGGTGTLVFLIGVGMFERDRFVLRQFFLSDVASEVAMLTRVAEVLDGRPAIVSFNGRRFDLPLILTRLTLARVRAPDCGDHIDLLYPARWLYKRRLRSCTLRTLESCVLGLEREGDVSGSLAPAIYLNYMRTGNVDGLRGVFEHNALDILSLVVLLGRIGGVCQGTDAAAEDFLALGHWDESAGRTVDAITMFRSALERARTEEQRSVARRRLGRLHKRLGKLDRAMPVWQEEVEAGAPEGKAEALIELAKVSEHQLRDFRAAEGLTRRALDISDSAGYLASLPRRPQLERRALEHRLKRLAKRLSGTNSH